MPAPIRPSIPGSGTSVPPVDEDVVLPPEVVDEVVVPPDVVEVVVPPEVDEVEVDVEEVLPHIALPAGWPQLQ